MACIYSLNVYMELQCNSLFCSNIQKYLCLIFHSFLHLSLLNVLKLQLFSQSLFLRTLKLRRFTSYIQGVLAPCVCTPCAFRCFRSYLWAYVNVLGKVGTMLGQVTAETTVNLSSFSSVLCPPLILWHILVSFQRLALWATLSWHCKEKYFMKFPCFSLLISRPNQFSTGKVRIA